jgi:phosphatidylglycerol:prolipoprotein diacylglycerol transferase
MRQVLLVVPGLGLTLHSFSLMILLACLGALYITAWRARREGLDPDDVYRLALWLFPGGIIGARLAYIIQHPEAVRQVADLVRIWQGGIVFYGCIAGGLIGSVICWARRPFPFRPMADAVAPALCVGIAFGRVGCFLNGCCFGAPSQLPWAVRFPAGTPPWGRHVDAGWIPAGAPTSLPVHPTQIYSALCGLALLGLLWAYFPRRRRDGEVMALLMVAYPITRFLVEGLRGDEPTWLAGLTAAQLVSIGLLACGLASWALLARAPVGRHADRARGVAPPIGIRATRPDRVPDTAFPGR